MNIDMTSLRLLKTPRRRESKDVVLTDTAMDSRLRGNDSNSKTVFPSSES